MEALLSDLGADFNSIANFNETFPLFNWYVVETDVTHYSDYSIHTVYDAGRPADGTLTTCRSATSKPGSTAPANGTGFPACGESNIGANMADAGGGSAAGQPVGAGSYLYCPDAVFRLSIAE